MGSVWGVRACWIRWQTQIWLQQTQLASASNCFRPPLDLELAKDFLVVPFDRIPGDNQLCRDLVIRESLGNELQDLHLPAAERLDESVGCWLDVTSRRLRLGRPRRPQPAHIPRQYPPC